MIRGSVSASRGSQRVRLRRRTIYLTTRPAEWPVNVAPPCDAAGDLEWVFARTRTTTALALWVGGGAVAGLVLAGAKWWALVPIAFVLGWLNLSGQCAQNAITAITPMASDRSRKAKAAWVQCVVAYTVAGVVASATVGFGLSELGSALGLQPRAIVLVLTATCLYVVLREGVGLPLPLLEPRRNSNRNWARFGQPAASVMWGFDVGLFFTTWMTYASAWWLVAVAICVGVPGFGATLFVVYWLGRAALLAVGIWTVPNGRVTAWLPQAWVRFRRPFELVDAVAVVLGTVIAVVSM